MVLLKALTTTPVWFLRVSRKIPSFWVKKASVENDFEVSPIKAKMKRPKSIHTVKLIQ